ncbi:MAG TPA: cell surface protein [Burkholderiaceae bacterium]|nr:cell surface protein [Burkholderiaceae bacterium]
MKKSLLSKSAVALAAGLLAAGAAQAIVVGPAGGLVNTVAPATVLEVNPAGLGHSLLVPYYTAQGGNDTYLSIVNTDMRNGKAVKIRFRGASNSDDVLDFTILLSPGDVWAAAVSKPAGQDLPKLTTSDKSCTLPAIPANGVNFNPARLHQKLTAAQQASETREGYVEIFNMADIPPTAAPAANASVFDLYRAIEHVNGTPRGCAQASVTALLDANLVSTTNYAGAQALGLEVPTTGLMANWNIVNVPNAASWSGQATAIEARVAAQGAAGYGNVVLFPQIDTQTIDAATARPFTADALLRGGNAANNGAEVPGAQVLTALPVDFPDMSTPYLNADLALLANGVATKSQTSRLMASFATLSVANEYNTLAGVSGKNDWTFTMPTRRYNVVRNYDNAGANESAGSTLYTNLSHDDAGGAIVGNNDYFTSGGQVVSNTNEGKRHQLCVTGITFSGGAKGGAEGTNRNSGVTADREEAFVAAGSAGAVFSPSVPGTPASFCGEASVLTFNNLSALSPEVAKRDVGTTASEGWMRFATPNSNLGLPILGNSFVQFTNNAATAGVKGNYGLAWPHRTSIR